MHREKSRPDKQPTHTSLLGVRSARPGAYIHRCRVRDQLVRATSKHIRVRTTDINDGINHHERVLRNNHKYAAQLRSTWHCRRSIRDCRTQERRTQDAMCTWRAFKNHTGEGRWGVPRMHREISRPDKQPKHASLLGLPPRRRNTFRGRTITSRSTATRRSGQALRHHQ